MSTVSVTNLKNAASGTNNIVLATDGSVSISGNNYSPQTGFKNRIINGAMTIDQRNAGAAVTTSSSFPVDRFKMSIDTDATFTAQRSSVAPVGFINSLLFTTTSPDPSLGALQYAAIEHQIEGFNIADFGWGTANAQPITISFWVRCSLTGVFGGNLKNADNNRSYPFTYTISAANTYEYKTITIAGDTTGTWLTTNGSGIRLQFGLGVGSSFSGTAGSWQAASFISATGAVSVVGTSGATFYITGVQLEKGSVATPFEFRSIGTELALCQRYFEKSYDAGTVPGANTTSGSIRFRAPSVSVEMPVNFSVSKRAAPTVVMFSTTGASGSIRDISTTTDSAAGGVSIGESWWFAQKSAAGVDGNQYGFHFTASAEL
jgi:hypothetical protein